MNKQIRLFTILGFLGCLFFTNIARAQSPDVIWQLPFTLDREYYSVKFSSDNTQLIAGGGSSLGGAPSILIKRFNAGNGTEIASTPLNYYFGRARELAVSPDGLKIVAANDNIRCNLDFPPVCDGGYRQFDALQLNSSSAVPPDGNAKNFTADYSPDGQYIALGGSYYNYAPIDYNNLRLVRASDLSIVRTMQGHFQNNNVGTLRARFSPDGTMIGSSGFDKFVKIWRVSDGTLLRSINFDNAYQVDSVAFSPDGQYIAAGRYGADAQVKVWRVSTGELVKTFDVSSTFANTLFNKVAWTPDGRYVAAGISFSPGYGSNKIRFWDFETGQLAQEYSTQADRFINDLTFSRDGQRFAWAASSQVFVAVNPFPGRTSSDSRAVCDFDGDGKSDVSVYRSGTWYIQGSANGFRAAQFGAAADKLVPADYDGDGKTDIAVYRSGVWYVLRSRDNSVISASFGSAEDIPRPADFDGDGRADFAVFRPSNGTWYLSRSLLGFSGAVFGQSGDIPMPADYDGDGKADIAVFRPSNGIWYRINSSNRQFVAVTFGQTGDVPVRGDFDNDGKADVAVFRPSNGTWYLNRSTGGFTGITFGQNGDTPVAGDYDGDGKTDLAVFRNGTWYVQQSTNGFTGTVFGIGSDVPAPALQ